ncbi:hypothetical protein INT45_011351 [Circinella minor]|uniref:Uncharacterized protein n=1 Tax=Circinella minor TaxID=1195481 RepID=A0A8H7RYR2_9FUNG|nr:hypothetical protein INT45_011351 [Circinella minor]
MSFLYNSDSSAEYISIIANGSKRMKRNTSCERERERQRRRRQQQQQQLTVDHEPQHAQEMPSDPHNNHSNCYLENLRDDGCDYGHDIMATIMSKKEILMWRITQLLNKRVRDVKGQSDDAYFRGIGQNDIDLTALDPPATRECSCVRSHDISFCNNCPDGSRSLPVVLLEKHIFPTTPTDTKIAIHIDVLRCYNNVRLHARASINSIAELMKANYDWTELPATLRNTMYHALPNYTKFKLLLDDHINRPEN